MRWNFTVRVTLRTQTVGPQRRHEVSRAAYDGREGGWIRFLLRRRVARKFVKRRRPLYGPGFTPGGAECLASTDGAFPYETANPVTIVIQSYTPAGSSILRSYVQKIIRNECGAEWNYCPPPPSSTGNGNPGYVRRRVKHRFEISGVHDPAVSGQFVPANSLDFPHKFSTLLLATSEEEHTRQIEQTAKNDPMLDYGTEKNICFMCW